MFSQENTVRRLAGNGMLYRLVAESSQAKFVTTRFRHLKCPWDFRGSLCGLGESSSSHKLPRRLNCFSSSTLETGLVHQTTVWQVQFELRKEPRSKTCEDFALLHTAPGFATLSQI